MKLTQEFLKSILRYDLLTGDFTWLLDWSPRARKGDIAGTVFNSERGKKYYLIGINKKLYYAHRLAFLYVLSAFPENEVDHINGDGLDNRWINLRPVTHIENSKNVRLGSKNTSGHVGVYWHKPLSKWMSGIRVNQKNIYLGVFSNVKDAIKARKKAEIKYGFHENHGTERPL